MKKQNIIKTSREEKGLLFGIRYFISLAFIILFAFMASGCGDSSYFETVDSSKEASSENSGASKEFSNVSDEKNPSSSSGSPESADLSSNDEKIYVQIAGAVRSPGVYEMQKGDRIFQVVEKAGGFSDDAYEASVNQAKHISDGDFIRIYTVSEVESFNERREVSIEIPLSESEASDIDVLNTASENDGLINLNTASKEELMTLPGIGESKADMIIAYREEKGSFQNIEDIMNISGIKEKAFSKVKDKITV